MPGFDCVVSMIDSNVPVFLSLSLALLKTDFSGGKLEKTSCCKGFVLSQPVNPGGRVYRGESVREGETRGGKLKKRPGKAAGALLKKGALLPCTFRLLNWPGESGLYNLSMNRWNKPDGNWKSNLQEVMVVQYFRAIDGLGRIVLPAELLHHLNWEKGKISVSIEEKDGCLIVSSIPAAGQPPAPPSLVNSLNSPDGQSKIISLPASKK
mgnify:CR=1 FL=1